jgi:hypothetical protein
MASIVSVEQIKGLAAGSTPNTITVPTGQKVVGTDAGSIVTPGHIIQTQHATMSSMITVSSTAAYTDILSCSITTLHANSKILIQAVVPNYSNNPNSNTWTNSHYIKLHESGTGIVAAFEHPGPQTSMEFSQASPILHMTGAKSVGAYTYTVTVKPTVGGDSHYFGRSTDGHNSYTQMIVQEIAQ